MALSISLLQEKFSESQIIVQINQDFLLAYEYSLQYHRSNSISQVLRMIYKLIPFPP